MNTKTYAALCAAAAAIILAGCNQAGEGAGGTGALALMSMENLIADMSQSSLDTVNDGMTDINTSGQTDLSYNVRFPGSWMARPNLQERIISAEGGIMSALSADAATISCPGGGSVDVTDTAGTWNSANGSFYVVRTFNDCKGPYGHFKVSGDAVLHWTGMNAGTTGAGKLQIGSKLEQAPVNKRFTRTSTGGYVTVEGNGGTLTDGSLTGAIAHTVTWTNVSGTSRSFDLVTDLTRRGYTASGTLVFEHQVTTPTNLAITADLTSNTRTVSGTIRVVHALAGVTIDTAFTGLSVPMDTCIPVSGSATITISGTRNGSGTITFDGNGMASYSYTVTNLRGRTFSGSGTFAVTGCQ